jgi:hypothetical protein
VVQNFCSYACQTKKVSPPPSTVGLAKAWPSAVRQSCLIFRLDEGVIIWLPKPLLPPGPLGLLLFTAEFPADVMDIFFVSVFTFSPHFLSVFALEAAVIYLIMCLFLALASCLCFAATFALSVAF